jgi:hypothetical protein
MKQVFIKKASITLLLLLTPLFLNSQTQIGNDIDGEAAGDQSSWSLNVSSAGDIVAIGANNNFGVNGIISGHVRVYRNNNGNWEQIGSDIDGEGASDKSGSSVSLSLDGNIIAIGAPYNNNGNKTWSGHVRVYRNNNEIWEQIGSDIDGEAAEDFFGESVSLSSNGSILAISARYNDGNGDKSGHVRVYQNNNGTWEQIGSDINGEAINDFSGSGPSSIDLSSDGSIVAIGADSNDGNGENSGHVRVYQNINGTWGQIGSDIDGEAVFNYSGHSISLSSNGSIVAIGAIGNTGNGANSGHVRVYQNNNGVWEQVGSDINGESANDHSGISISLSSDGSIVAIGARYNFGNGINSGYVRIYRTNNGSWEQVGVDINGESVDDLSGSSVSLSSNGSIVAIGARNNDGNGANSGHVRVYNLSTVLKTTDFLVSKFNVFPNPVTNSFTIQLKENIQLKKVSIYNGLGQFIKSSKILTTNTSNLTKGIYVLKIETDKGTASKKLVIE